MRLDIKAYLNQESFKIQEDNKPRVFANTIKIENDQSQFTKSIFLHYVIIEKMINALLGRFKQKK